MIGPEPLGHWSNGDAPNCSDNYDFLRAGRRYRVISEFRDNDGTIHPVGETWTFVGSSFLPYDDGLSWFVTFDDTHEWHIPMQLRPEEQQAIVNSLENYLEPVCARDR